MNASIQSMTGFARAEGEAAGQTFAWELRSVNARGLEMRCRMPGGLESLEPAARRQISQAMKRGNVVATLAVAKAVTAGEVRINGPVLEQILQIVAEVQRRLPQSPPPRIEGLLALRGVIESGDETLAPETRAEFEAALLAALGQALERLIGERRSEGGRLAATLAGHFDRLAGLCAEAESRAAEQPEAVYARLKEQLAALLAADSGIPADRLAQEAALLATRADVREELDRLRSHCEAARDLLRQGGSVGRQLDFLCQEFNREANTLCSKSGDVALTRVGLDMKAVIDQVREQVQNLE
jgi:uncharacterized protein (TIGR00255 family)